MLSCLDMSRPLPLALDMNESAALCGSGVPCGFPPNPYCDANDRFENCDVDEAGLLPRPPKLSVLLCTPLTSLPLLTGWAPGWPAGCSWGGLMLPFGVLMFSVGRAGREGFVGWLMPPGPAPTGFTLGDGGMARPSLGVRGPLLRPPPMAGRRRGAGVFIMGTGFGDDIGAIASWGFICLCQDVSAIGVIGGESKPWWSFAVGKSGNRYERQRAAHGSSLVAAVAIAGLFVHHAASSTAKWPEGSRYLGSKRHSRRR